MKSNNGQSFNGVLVEWLKIAFDFVVIIVMVWAVLVSLGANRQAREALNWTHTPWLKVTGIAIDDQAKIKYTLQNFSSTPAIDLTVETVIAGVKGSPSTYTHDALMPNESGGFSFRYVGQDFPKLANDVNAGTIPILFRISYRNILGQPFEVEQEIRYIDDMFRDVRYQKIERSR